jgi:hypothetical protein
MDYRSAYIRRSRKGSRLKKRVAAVALAGVAGCAGMFALAMGAFAPAPAAQGQAVADSAAPAPTVLRAAAQVEAQEKLDRKRRIYPYSIVPGGLADRKELVHAIVMDKVVAVHYAAFEADKATVETVRKPRAVYVSYRKGDKVYWTAKKLHLAEGETLLSDGKNEIRGRCGNRISDVPQQPVEARGPSEEELDSSVAADDAGEGGVQQVGLAVDGNPAGQGYQLQTFGTGGTTQSGNTSTHTSATLTSVPDSGLGPILDGGTLPVAMVSKTSSDTSDTSGSGTGTPGTPGTETAPASTGGTTSGTTIDTKDTPPGGSAPGSGTPSGGGTKPATTPNTPVQPATDPETKPLPGTLLPPTTDLPGQTNPPGKSPTKPTNVPEPGTLWLGGAGVAALLASRRAKKRPRK